MAKTLEQKLNDTFTPVLEELGYELVDIEYKKEGKDWFLRFFVDSPKGLNLNDCQLLTEKINPILDEIDPIPHQYLLEVSSPGLYRPINKEKDFARFYGQKVRVKLHAAHAGQKNFLGVLINNNAGTLTIEINGKPTGIPKSLVAKVTLEPDF